MAEIMLRYSLSVNIWVQFTLPRKAIYQLIFCQARNLQALRLAQDTSSIWEPDSTPFEPHRICTPPPQDPSINFICVRNQTPDVFEMPVFFNGSPILRNDMVSYVLDNLFSESINLIPMVLPCPILTKCCMLHRGISCQNPQFPFKVLCLFAHIIRERGADSTSPGKLRSDKILHGLAYEFIAASFCRAWSPCLTFDCMVSVWDIFPGCAHLFKFWGLWEEIYIVLYRLLIFAFHEGRVY